MADKEFLLKNKEAEQIYLRKDEYDYIKYQTGIPHQKRKQLLVMEY